MRFLFLLVLLVAFGFFYSWTNIWVPTNHFGVLFLNSTDGENSKSDTPILIEKKGFHWIWKRIIPFQTTLLTFNSSAKIYESTLSLYLPNSYSLSQLARVSEQSFITDISIRILYNLDSQKIIEYLTSTAFPVRPMNELDFITHIKQKIDIITFTLTEEGIMENISTTNEGLHAHLTSAITQKITEESSLLPIQGLEVNIEILRSPDMETYNYAQQLENTSSLLRIAQPQDAPVQWMEQYLYFINALGNTIEASPHILELVKILPPHTFRDAFQDEIAE